MKRKFLILLSTAIAVVLIPALSVTIPHAHAAMSVVSRVIKTANAPALAGPNDGQRHLVRVVDVTGTPCASSGAADPNTIAYEHVSLLAHRARLEAEIQGRENIVIPEALRGQETSELVQRAFRDEAIAMQSRQAQIAEQIQQVQQGIELMKQESDVIQKKDAMMQRQVSLLQEQLDTVDGLLKRGAATVSQKLALEQNLATFESSHLDLQLASLKSRQEWLKAQQSIADVGNQLRSQDLIELSQTEARLSELSKHVAVPANAEKPADAACSQASGPVFEIVAGKGGAMQVLPIAPIAGAQSAAGRQALASAQR
jgi:hypothetical protein